MRKINPALKNCLTPKPSNRYYVYTHETEAGEIFYVGKGSENRAWICTGRGTAWEKVANHNLWVVNIVCDGLTEEQAGKIEKALIHEKKTIHKLTNTAHNR